MFREKTPNWTIFKQRRPKNSVISDFYTNSVQFWDTIVEHFPPLEEVLKSAPGDNIAGRFRHKEGGHLLFRPVGLLIIANVIRQTKDAGLKEKEAIKRISEVSMELTDEPWVGLLWDKTNHRMISGTTPQKVARQLLFYCIGGNPADMKTNIEAIRREYAGLLNRDESEVKLQQQYKSLL